MADKKRRGRPPKKKIEESVQIESDNSIEPIQFEESENSKLPYPVNASIKRTEKHLENVQAKIQENEIAIHLPKDLTPKELAQIWLQQSSDLTDQITSIENALMEVRADINFLMKELIANQEDRRNIKQVILVDQELLFKNEKKLIRIDDKEFEYTADMPKLFRVAKELISGQPDDILTANRIANHEAKIKNGKRQLAKINDQVAGLALSLLYQENIFETLEETSSRFREIRRNFSKDYRGIRDEFLENDSRLKEKNTLNLLKKNVSIINSAVEDFQDMTVTARNFIEDKYHEFDRLKEDLWRTKTADNELDEGLDHLISKWLKDINKHK
jgi:hypothetical protein